MAKLPVISGKVAVKVFTKHFGYEHDRTNGDHAILVHEERPTLSVPLHSELKKGTLRALIRDAGVEREEFEEAYNEI